MNTLVRTGRFIKGLIVNEPFSAMNLTFKIFENIDFPIYQILQSHPRSKLAQGLTQSSTKLGAKTPPTQENTKSRALLQATPNSISTRNQSRSTLRVEPHGGSEHPRANSEQELTQIRSTLIEQGTKAGAH
jgi:hypothetical protein